MTIHCCWIQPSQSNFGSPGLFMSKPDGTPRICINCRAVNAIAVNRGHPLPHIDDLLNSLLGSCWVTKLDVVAGYHESCITTADRQKTAFTAKFGLYEWRVPQFRLLNAPSEFMRLMNHILETMNSQFILIYLDNSVIHSRTLAEHIVHVREVLTLLTENGLKAE